MALSTPARTATTITPEVVRARLQGRRVDVGGRIFRGALLCALLFSLGILAILIFNIASDGIGVLTSRTSTFVNGTLRSLPSQAGVAQGLRGTFWIGVFVVLFGFPLGIAAAIYLEEYAPSSRFTRFVDINIRNLAGVPSIVYGILGFAILVDTLGGVTGGRSVVSGGLTLAVLVLPIVIITSAEAIRAVPSGLREAAYGVGATRWEVVRHHVLPYAAPGILTGTVLSLARALGEAAPLILIGAVTDRLGSNPSVIDVGSLTDRFTAMPNVITTWAGQAQSGFRANTAAAIIVLMLIVLVANTAAILLRNHYESKRLGH
ncbi:MAG TPA: phosphate ABC transporter permease PstA [Acidimicrobiales bacterium]|nr:phosphate ABC transporter permease PstA [Acidimicrobiales bacterium]